MESQTVSKAPSHQYVINDALHHLFDAVNAISVQAYDDERRVIYWNVGSELLYGYTKEEAFGRKLEDLIIPADMRAPVINAHTNWINEGHEIPSAEITLHHKNGSNVNVFSSHVMFTNQYDKKQMYCIDINLADVKKAHAQAQVKEHLLETIIDAIPDLFLLMKIDGTIIDYHASDQKIPYISPSQYIGKHMADILPVEVVNKFHTHIKKVLQQHKMISFEYELKMPDGMVYFEARISYLSSSNQIVTIIRDISDQYKSAELIKQQAYFDTLTSLPNRFLSLDRLSQMLIEADRIHEKTAVLFLDLDDFKKVNDSLGHEVGDKILIESAIRLKKAVKKVDVVGRLGGDEFIVLLRSIKDHRDALAVAEELLQLFRCPFHIDDRELILTLSIGIAMYPDNGCSSSDLLRNADTAMYEAKSLGRNTYSFYTKEMNAVTLRRFDIEEQMRGALERDEFELYYQPQIDVESGSIIGAEALLRWKNVSLGNITPDEFIPIAEQTGLIVPIGRHVIQQALNFLKLWQINEQKSFTIAVNLSPLQFRDAELLSCIKAALLDTSINATSLEIEITEGVLMGDQSYIHDALIEMNQLGIKLSMDDFGTGYSSLSYLREYSFDVLKIDQSFIHGIPKNQADCKLVKATIAMAHSLGLTVVAEGVETESQLSLLDALDCDVVQGYYFSKPIPAGELIDFSINYLQLNSSN
jgi:diguanylate cyclase (GGDEF)-like protein/PAS domain S-box-containing protein